MAAPAEDKTFSKTSFDYASYASNRPTYPPSLIDLVLSFCDDDKREHALDLGCGHGVATRALAAHFAHVTGCDPSEGMLSAACSSTPNKNITYEPGTSTSLPASVPPRSLDLISASQAAHWFPLPASWTHLATHLKPRGMLALWGYSDPVLPASGAATDALHAWTWRAEVAGKQALGSHWVRPGRDRIESLYAPLAADAADARDADGNPLFEHVRWLRNDARVERPWFASEEGIGPSDGARRLGNMDEHAERLGMRRKMTVREFKRFVRTWSASHWWAETHKEDRPREEGGTGDVADWMWDSVLGVEEGWRTGGEELKVDVEWPVGLVLARRVG